MSGRSFTWWMERATVTLRHMNVLSHRSPLLLVLPLALAAVSACGSAEGKNGSSSTLPPNVTVFESEPSPTPIPEDLATTASQIGELVDWHDEALSGVWYDASDETLHVGVASNAGRALLDEKGLLNEQGVVAEDVEHSLVEGQEIADKYHRHSTLGKSIVGWGALPEGDGIELFVTGDHLTSDELAELGDLDMRVVVLLGQGQGTLD